MSADEAITDVAPQSAADNVAAKVEVSSLGNVTSDWYNIGFSDTNNRRYRLQGLSFATGTPAVVLIQPRQIGNVDEGYPDQFAVQVITTSTTSIVCRVLRIDSDYGWGQQVRLDLFVVESVR